MSKIVLFVSVIVAVGVSSASFVPSVDTNNVQGTGLNVQVPSFTVSPTKFQYIGNAEGKIFLKAELSPEEVNGVSWQRAIEICADAGKSMASITSKTQDDVIRNWIMGESLTSSNWVWIDGTNFANFANSNFTWFSTQTGKNLEYFNWVQGRPVNPPSSNRQCLRWSRNSMESGWWDIGCDDKHNVLCQDLVN